MRRVAFRFLFETLDRRDHPGSWGIFNILDPISTLLDHSHGKSKTSVKAVLHSTEVSTTALSGKHLAATHALEKNAHSAHTPARDPHQSLVVPHPAATQTVTVAKTSRS